MEHNFLLFYVIDSVAIEKGVCCSRRKYTLDKVCRLTMVETILRSAKVKPAHISEEFKNKRKLKIIPIAKSNKLVGLINWCDQAMA